MKRRPPPCGLVGRHGLKRARPYVSGWCCDLHTPAALAGRPEAPPGPGWPPGAYLYANPEPNELEQTCPPSPRPSTSPSADTL